MLLERGVVVRLSHLVAPRVEDQLLILIFAGRDEHVSVFFWEIGHSFYGVSQLLQLEAIIAKHL